MPDIYLYEGEPNPADIKLSDPTVLRSSGGTVIVEADANASGSSTAIADAVSVWNVAATAAGASAGTGLAAAVSPMLAASIGASTVAAVSAAVFPSVAQSDGVGVAAGAPSSVFASVASSAGGVVALADAEDAGGGSPIIVEAVAEASGTSTAQADSEDIGLEVEQPSTVGGSSRRAQRHEHDWHYDRVSQHYEQLDRQKRARIARQNAVIVQLVSHIVTTGALE